MLEDAQFAELITPYITMLVGLIISLSAKDFITGFVKGLAFRLNPLFREGDLVIVDGEYAIVMKIGIRNTIFGIDREGGDSTWLSVENQRISYLKIEKVIQGASGRRNSAPSTDNPVPLNQHTTPRKDTPSEE